ncbi:MAG: AAA family ATPase, partial [Anaerolineae bacterium]|nr:AAA family ATPase [Anaerolineae bacterium]
MTEREQLEQAIVAQEGLRAALGDAVVDATVAVLRQRLAALEKQTEAAPLLEGERKLVTILFADISGFTALAETMDPETVRDLMNTCFERLVPVIETYGGTVDKFTGDGIMALFGAPVAHENDAERALRAALEMRASLVAFNQERTTRLGIHFGVNTGLVIAGGIGTRERQEYSVMGDAVNLAARLEDLSTAGEVLVGPDTYRLTAPLFDFDALAPIFVKGKTERVPMYRLLAAKAVRGKVRGIAGLESELVGRADEFDALKAALVRLLEGEGGVVTLVGEAGLGKSRLVAELRSHLEGRPVVWVEGRCLSYGSSLVYLLWLDILRDLLGVSAEDAPALVDAQLQARVRDLCADRFAEVYPYLARLMSLPMAAEFESVLRDVDGERLKSATFRAVECLLGEVARRHPLVLVGEDLHWSDVASLELLQHVLGLSEQVPILFLCLFRPERAHACWGVLDVAAQYGARYVDVRLEPLTTDESKTLVGNLLRVEGLPVALRERILSHAEGNPFYVEEIIRSLLDEGAIAHDVSTDRWVAAREVDDIAIPDTLHGVLMARIDRLEEETKRVLQLASVIGRIFFYRVLAAIAQEERSLDTRVATLQREEMIRERTRQPELEYIFKHHLTQEAAYNGLLKKDRRTFHRQVAQALERLFPDRIDEQAGLLAYHWEQAEEAEQAVAYLLKAGDQARIIYAHREAIDYYERALAFLRQREAHEVMARTLMKLGLLYHMVFDFRRSRLAYSEGFALRQRIGEAQVGQLPPAPHALRSAVTGEPPTLCPTLAEDARSIGLIKQLFSGLVSLTPDMDIVPDVAHSWETQESGRTFVFFLREDVRWSDGSPVTAADFAYAWKRVLDPDIGSPAASMLYDIKGARAFNRGEGTRDDVGVQALDDLTLVVTLEEPTGYFLHLLTYSAFLPIPRHVVERVGDGWATTETIVTNGPFCLKTWNHSDVMVLERNPSYHEKCTGNVERVEADLKSLPPDKNLEAYERGELDYMALPARLLEQAREKH